MIFFNIFVDYCFIKGYYMKKLILFALVLCMTSCILENTKGQSENYRKTNVVNVGDKLPDFNVKIEGKKVAAKNILEGKISVICFFNKGCSHCQKEMPEINKLWNKIKNMDDVVFMSFGRDEKEMNDVQAYFATHGLSFPFALDADREIFKLFAGAGIPRVYISDKRSIIKYISIEDFIEADIYLREINELLKH